MKRMQRVFGDLDALRYVDGRLEPDRKAAFAAHLAEDPSEAERVAIWGRQTETLRAAFAGVTLESVPPALRVGHVLPQRPAPGGAPLALQPPSPRGSQDGASPAIVPATVAYLGRSKPASRRPDLRLPLSAAVLLGLAILIVYVAHGLLAAPAAWTDEVALLGRPSARRVAPAPTPASRAADAFSTYALDPVRPVEFTAAQTGLLSHWVKRRLGVAIEPADLTTEGWTLLGGRLVAGTDSPAAFFVYEDHGGDRLGLLVTRAAPSSPAGVSLAATEAGLAALSWSGGSFAYAIISDKSVDWLSRNGEPLREHVVRPAVDASEGQSSPARGL